MKKLMTMMLALAFMTGTVAVTFAQDQPEKKTEKKKKKGSKKKKGEKKDEQKPAA